MCMFEISERLLWPSLSGLLACTEASLVLDVQQGMNASLTHPCVCNGSMQSRLLPYALLGVPGDVDLWTQARWIGWPYLLRLAFDKVLWGTSAESQIIDFLIGWCYTLPNWIVVLLLCFVLTAPACAKLRAEKSSNFQVHCKGQAVKLHSCCVHYALIYALSLNLLTGL